MVETNVEIRDYECFSLYKIAVTHYVVILPEARCKSKTGRHNQETGDWSHRAMASSHENGWPQRDQFLRSVRSCDLDRSSGTGKCLRDRSWVCNVPLDWFYRNLCGIVPVLAQLVWNTARIGQRRSTTTTTGNHVIYHTASDLQWHLDTISICFCKFQNIHSSG